ncbi:MAG: ABC transporter transmembrane domain-containing protein, partial [Pseudomonadota bacterium]
MKKSGPDIELSTDTRILMRRIIHTYLKSYIPTLIGATVLMVIAAAMTGTLAKMMEPIIDDVFTAQDEDMLWPVALAVFGAFAIRGFATYGHSVMLNKVGQRVVADIQRDLFAHIMTLDLGFFQKMKSGQLLSRVISDATVMRSSVAESLMGV